ncbi:MAG: hypothetical protein IKD07_04275, partial [Clostridia bacterium]|nr:hypothetical protein [Clostridia bacterium]
KKVNTVALYFTVRSLDKTTVTVYNMNMGSLTALPYPARTRETKHKAEDPYPARASLPTGK